jgi:hypothetical protein
LRHKIRCFRGALARFRVEYVATIAREANFGRKCFLFS